MTLRTIAATLVATALLGTAAAVPAHAGDRHGGSKTGTKSLAQVLTSDGNRFDKRSSDYDIVTEAALAVLAAKPDSPVKLLTQGNVRLTAFLPDDWSFRELVRDLTGKRYRSERAVFHAVESLGVDTIETVLLYHVIPGATITAKDALASDGVALTTAQGGTVTVDVIYPKLPIVQLGDQDPDDTDPFLNPSRLNINKGNKQIAHGIFFVLRPANL